jgi:hypothetical protein
MSQLLTTQQVAELVGPALPACASTSDARAFPRAWTASSDACPGGNRRRSTSGWLAGDGPTGLGNPSRIRQVSRKIGRMSSNPARGRPTPPSGVLHDAGLGTFMQNATAKKIVDQFKTLAPEVQAAVYEELGKLLGKSGK